MTLSCVIADDHPALLVAVADYLEQNGFDVVAAAGNSAAALSAARETRPALALLDYRMPGSAGATLVREVKQASPETRVAVYTADADEKLVAEALAAGADGVVLKDAPLDDLVRALRSVHDGRPSVDPGLAPFGLVRGPAQSGLTPREMEVLRLLAENAGRLVTKDEIISEVWDDVAVTEDSLTQCITDIRKALGDERYYKGKYVEAAGIMARMSTARACADFLTLPSYHYLD